MMRLARVFAIAAALSGASVGAATAASVTDQLDIDFADGSSFAGTVVYDSVQGDFVKLTGYFTYENDNNFVSFDTFGSGPAYPPEISGKSFDEVFTATATSSSEPADYLGIALHGELGDNAITSAHDPYGFSAGAAATEIDLTPGPTPPVSAAPEPSAWALMILAVAAAGFSMRRAKLRRDLNPLHAIST